eukprot:gnl/MRDRNA2_/MRDRNA2_49136_c0_seq1.p1 gnl/MRDRNA2_/MRDRNA2_49136_c0~~gnl/MRDRNA2_/MRDRNA2_49136_c0_seq1.p1  ORF type:complete len:167 (+),score=35.85 gnl/MRDRNA2_/MRDRNA2_49136_c0_seq1:81-581(+)
MPPAGGSGATGDPPMSGRRRTSGTAAPSDAARKTPLRPTSKARRVSSGLLGATESSAARKSTQSTTKARPTIDRSSDGQPSGRRGAPASGDNSRQRSPPKVAAAGGQGTGSKDARGRPQRKAPVPVQSTANQRMPLTARGAGESREREKAKAKQQQQSNEAAAAAN